MSLRRFQVTEHSMVPTLLPGDEFVVNTNALAMRGDVVAAPHPDRDGFWLVKRLVGLSGDTIIVNGEERILGRGEAWVLSDDPQSAVDSRQLGAIPHDALLPMVSHIDAETFEMAVALLAGEDEALAGLVGEVGIPPFWSRPPGFTTTVILILEQQVSLESAAAVYWRLKERVGEVNPDQILALSIDELNGLGLTRQKAGYVTDLARSVMSGELDFDEISALDTDSALGRLQELRGIGRWTAEAYLLAADGRPDIFPVGDRALQVATGEALGMDHTPDPSELEIVSAPWKPIRSVAARILWHGYLSRRGRSEPVH